MNTFIYVLIAFSLFYASVLFLFSEVKRMRDRKDWEALSKRCERIQERLELGARDHRKLHSFFSTYVDNLGRLLGVQLVMDYNDTYYSFDEYQDQNDNSFEPPENGFFWPMIKDLHKAEELEDLRETVTRLSELSETRP